MAFRRNRAEPEPPRSLVAAASQINLDGSSWKNWKFGDQKWQEEAWRQYDICGELRYVANWVGNAISRCRIYIADVDRAGRPGEEVTNNKIVAIGESMFGGPAGRAEAQRALGIHLTVPGEAYVVAESVANAKEDIWYVASTTEVRKQGGKVIVNRSNVFGGGKRELDENKDLLIRVWTPHPRQFDLADSSVRAVLPILREIEQLTKFVFAQVDSRLAGAGVLLLPQELDFPAGDGIEPGIAGFQELLARAMGASLNNREDASSMVPVMGQVPGEFVDKIKHLTFSTDLTTSAKDLREEAIRRLGLALDVPPEVLTGQGSANHWSAWQIEESAIKIHVVPPLVRVVDALTTAFLRPALKAQGVDPEKYTFWYDTSPLTQRPDRQQEAKDLHAITIISDQALREAGNWSEEDAPDEAEVQRRLATELIKAQPQLVANAKLVELAGLPPEVAEAAQPPAPDAGFGGGGMPVEATDDRGLPVAPETTETPAQEGLAASARALQVGADMVVRRAMEVAGKRLLTRAARVTGAHTDTPADLLHTRLRVLNHTHARALLAGAFDNVPHLAEATGTDAQHLEESLRVYCTELLMRAAAHQPDALRMWLSMTGGPSG